MNIGFVGAGRMGHTMGRHLADYSRSAKCASSDDIQLLGFYSRSKSSAKSAAEFTNTRYYEDVSELVRECDVVFITTPDGQIEEVARMLAAYVDDSRDKIFVHTSGALSSQVFSGMGNHIYGYSVHPIYAVSSRTDSYVNFNESFITIEGHDKYLSWFIELFRSMGHEVKTLASDDKVKYHASAVFASNLVIGLYHMAMGLMGQCGFSEEEATKALMPLFVNNAKSLSERGCKDALTGPVARCDLITVAKHLDALSEDEKEVYKELSRELIKIAASNTEYDYTELKKILNDK